MIFQLSVFVPCITMQSSYESSRGVEVMCRCLGCLRDRYLASVPFTIGPESSPVVTKYKKYHS